MINELKPGMDNCQFTALINNVTVGKTNGANKSNYLNLTLSDESGEIEAKYWNVNEAQIKLFEKGTLVTGKGDIIDYNHQTQMKVIKLNKIEANDQEKIKYVKKAPIDINQTMEEIQEVIESMKDQDLKMIVKTILDNTHDDYIYAPAATRNHHAYASGLLFHSYTMMKLALVIVEVYPSLNRDLLIAGTLLHDIGKITELSSPISPSYTLEGNMLGHISIGNQVIHETAQSLHIEGESVTLLQHMILSHHGKNEYGSPVLPMIKEAEILNLVDNIDSRMDMFERILSTLEEGEYSKRIFSLDNRMIYKPNSKKNK